MTQLWNYQAWNKALGHHFFRPESAGEDVFLATDRHVLHEVSGLEEAEAEESFLGSIRSICGNGSRDLTGWARQSLLQAKRGGREWRPFCCALLCFQVYVAFQMENVEGEKTAANYWGTMNELLGFGLKSNYPKGLTGELHQSLWRDCMERWANDPAYHGESLGHLVLPPLDCPGHRHIALPLSQALLRREDCLRLYRFFHEQDLRPGESLETETLAFRLETGKPDLSTHAKRVLADPLRRQAALGQLVRLLEEWDGSCPERTKKSPYFMWMRFSKKRPERMQAGVARVGPDELKDTRGAGLEELLKAECRLDEVVYRPLDRSMRLLVRNDSLGCYLEQRYAGPEQELLLLLEGHRQNDVTSLLRHARIGFECLDVDLPKNWRLYWLETPKKLPGLPFFEPRRLSVRPVGGLKLRPGVWMAGAGPAIRISGEALPRVGWLDRQPIDIEAGEIRHPCLSRPGRHQLVIPGRGVKACFQVEEAEELGRFSSPLWEPNEPGWPAQNPGEAEAPAYLLGLQVVGPWPARPMPLPPTTWEEAEPNSVVSTPPPNEPAVEAPEQKAPAVTETSPIPKTVDNRQGLVVRLLVSLRRGVPLVSTSELLEGSRSDHALVRTLSLRLMGEQKETDP